MKYLHPDTMKVAATVDRRNLARSAPPAQSAAKDEFPQNSHIGSTDRSEISANLLKGMEPMSGVEPLTY